MKTNLKLLLTLVFSILLCSLNPANATTYPVTNINDAGAGSLRQAILDANANPGADMIDVTGVTGTITLTTGQLAIADALTITGPGANLLSITSSGDNNRIFYVGNVTATLSGLTIRDARLWPPDYDNNQENYDGAGLLNYGQLTLESCVVSGNSGKDYWVEVQKGAHGVGICNHGTLHINNSIIRNNIPLFDTTPILGGGIFNDGTLYINNSTIANNQANLAGGIWNTGSLTVTNSAITGNTGIRVGGGIDAVSGQFTITNTTISGNMGGDGGGIYILGGAGTILNSTITLNDGFGGGIYNYTYSLNGQPYPPGVFNIGNSIVAGNINHYDATVGADYSFPTGGIQPVGYANLTSLGHNIFGKVDDPWNWTFTGAGDQVGNYAFPVNPLLGALADNGGATFTHALLAGSPAINTGTCMTSIDQRGIARPQGITCDIGSYEDVVPYASIANRSITEGNSGTFLVKFKVTLDHAYGGTVKIKYATADSTATAGSDYVAAVGTIAFKPGVISKSISITITGDATLEPNERFKVKLSKAQNAILLDSLGIGTIKNDDAAPLVSASSVDENKVGDALGVKVMPNPNKGNFTLQMQLPTKVAATTLTFYNSLGEKVWQEYLGMVSGSISKNFDLENKLSSDVYVMKIERSDIHYTRKVVVNK